MTTTQLDPRAVAEALHIDTDDLARLLRKWAAETLTNAASAVTNEFVEYDRLERFDEWILGARRHLESAVAAEQAWLADNPLDEEEPDNEGDA